MARGVRPLPEWRWYCRGADGGAAAECAQPADAACVRLAMSYRL
jgi:hypothetical protein